MSEVGQDKRGVRLLDGEVCGLYRPGHQVHHIQANRAWGGMRKPGEVVGVEENGWIKVAVGHRIERFWHHDAKRARQIFAITDGRVEVSNSGLLMAGPLEDGSYYNLCVAKKGATPCEPILKDQVAIAQSGENGLEIVT